MQHKPAAGDAEERPFDAIDFGLMLAVAIIPPHWPFAVILGAQWVARRSPAVASYVLSSLDWQPDETPRWLLPGAAHLLPAPAADATPRLSHLVRRAAQAASSPRLAVVPAPQRATALDPRRRQTQTISPQEFAADPLFQALDSDPHRFIIGHTQGGKSTAMHGMAMAWAGRNEPVIVCDPDAARGQWPGCEVYGYAEDYRGIGQALDSIRDVFEDRSQLYADGQRDFAPMHLVIDEVHEVFDNVPGARDLVLDTLGRRGAKRGIRVTIGTQDQNKDTLGLDSAAVLSNFITAELAKDERGRRVATVYRGNAGKRQHVRTYAVPPLPGAKTFISPKSEPAPIVHARPAASTPVVAVTTTTTRLDEPADDLLSGLLAQSSPAPASTPEQRAASRAARLAAILAAQGEMPPQQSAVTVQRDGGDVNVYVAQQQTTRPPRAKQQSTPGLSATERRARADKYRQVRDLVAAGKSGNEICKILPGERQALQALVRQARQELGK